MIYYRLMFHVTISSMYKESNISLWLFSLLLFILISCQPPFHTSPEQEIPIPDAIDIGEFRYKLPEVTGFVEYRIDSGEKNTVNDFTASIGSKDESVTIRIDFGDSGLFVTIPITLDENRFLIFNNPLSRDSGCLFATLENDPDIWGEGRWVGTYFQEEIQASFYLDSDYSLNEIRLSLKAPIDLSELDIRGAVITEAELVISMESLFYGLLDLESQYSAEELRVYDNYDLLQSLNQQYNEAVFNSPETGLPALIEAMVTAEPDEGARLLLIADWISDNIYYNTGRSKASLSEAKNKNKFRVGRDVRSELSSLPLDETLIQILSSQKTICGGYASLFEEMAIRAGICSDSIIGYAGINSTGTALSPVGHAWNLALINGEPFFFDITWNSPGKYQDGEYIKQKPNQRQWTLVPPDIMINTHYPECENDQMLETPLSEEEYIARYSFFSGSYTNELFFQSGLSLVGGLKSVYYSSEMPISFHFTHPEGIEFTEQLRAGYQIEIVQVSETQTTMVVDKAVTNPEPRNILIQIKQEDDSDFLNLGRLYFNY